MAKNFNEKVRTSTEAKQRFTMGEAETSPTKSPNEKDYEQSSKENGGHKTYFDELLFNSSRDTDNTTRTRHMTFSGISLKPSRPEDENPESKSPRRYTDESKSPRRHADEMSPSQPVSKKSSKPVFSYDDVDIEFTKRSKLNS